MMVQKDFLKSITKEVHYSVPWTKRKKFNNQSN